MTYEPTEREDPTSRGDRIDPRSSPRTRRSAASPRVRRHCPTTRKRGASARGEEELPEEDPEKHAEGSFGNVEPEDE